jgi:hypothetical protein
MSYANILSVMKKTILTVVILLLSFIWCFFGGMVIYKIALNKPCVDLPLPISKENTRLEYDFLSVSDDYILVLDFYKKPTDFYGYAYLYQKNNISDALQRRAGDSGITLEEDVMIPSPRPPIPADGAWKSVELNQNDVVVKEVNSTSNIMYSVNATFKIDGQLITVSVPQIFLPMAIRGEKNFSKFGGSTIQDSAYFSVDGMPQTSKAALLVGLNFNPVDVEIDDAGIKTNWAMFFDANGNFYHLDDTQVSKVVDGYESHRYFSIQNDMTTSVFTNVNVLTFPGNVLSLDYSNSLAQQYHQVLNITSEITRQHSAYKMSAITGEFEGAFLKINQ